MQRDIFILINLIRQRLHCDHVETKFLKEHKVNLNNFFFSQKVRIIKF